MPSTYHRMKAALEAIAAGVLDPVELATETLRSRQIVAKPKPVRRKMEDISAAGRRRADLIYEQWLAAGSPSKKKFALSLNMHPNTGRFWIARGERQKRHREWREKQSRLYPRDEGSLS